MLQPVNLQLAHFNIEHSTQISKDAIAAAQQTAQGKEAVQESVKRTQTVQAAAAAAEPQKVKRKTEDERERQGGRQRSSFFGGSDSFEEDPQPEGQEAWQEAWTEKTEKRNSPKGFDFYA